MRLLSNPHGGQWDTVTASAILLHTPPNLHTHTAHTCTVTHPLAMAYSVIGLAALEFLDGPTNGKQSFAHLDVLEMEPRRKKSLPQKFSGHVIEEWKRVDVTAFWCQAEATQAQAPPPFSPPPHHTHSLSSFLSPPSAPLLPPLIQYLSLPVLWTL